MKNCPKCNAQVKDEAIFCNKCGFNFSQINTLILVQTFCRDCGAEVPNDSIFCTECGCNLEEALRIKKEEEERIKKSFRIENGVLLKYLGKESIVKIPNEVTTIGECAFIGCHTLQSIEIPNSVTCINENAFAACTNLTNIQIPNSVTHINEYAFNGCKSLKIVEIPSSVIELNTLAFAHCENLESIIVHQENNKYCSLDGVVFSKDGTTLLMYPVGRKVQSYKIPDTVSKIGSYAFYKCENLRNISLPHHSERNPLV